MSEKIYALLMYLYPRISVRHTEMKHANYFAIERVMK